MSADHSFRLIRGPEATLVELPMLTRLCGAPGAAGLGWSYVHGPELAPDAPGRERSSWSDVVLVERLRRAVARINPQLPAEAVTQVCDLALTSASPSVIENHRTFHELLLSGVPVSYLDRSGGECNDHAWLVDFDEPGSNEFSRSTS